MQKTLLEKAKSVKTRERFSDKEFSDEELELAMAYTKGEVHEKQVKTVVGCNTTQSFASAVFRWAVRKGKLVANYK